MPALSLSALVPGLVLDESERDAFASISQAVSNVPTVRSLASMELLLIISSTIQRYSLTPVHPGQALDTAEGFLRKPTGYLVKMKRRESSIED
jgi:hypothetical protein